MDKFEIVVHRGARELLSLQDLAAATGLHPELVERYVDLGLFEPSEEIDGVMLFGVETVPRLFTIQRLRREIGIGLPGIAIVLDLADKIRQLQREVEWLRNLR